MSYLEVRKVDDVKIEKLVHIPVSVVHHLCLSHRKLIGFSLPSCYSASHKTAASTKVSQISLSL